MDTIATLVVFGIKEKKGQATLFVKNLYNKVACLFLPPRFSLDRNNNLN